MKKISVIIIAKNEQNTIVDCIESVSFASEIIVVDDASEDNTVALARNLGAKIVHFRGDDNFSHRRNLGLETASNEWVVFIDADERVSKALAGEIQTAVLKEDCSGFYIHRQDHLWGKVLRYGETSHVLLLRVGKKTAGQWTGFVHEAWHITGKTEVLGSNLDHFPHQTLTEFLTEINHYTDLRAKELFAQKISVSWWDIILYPKAKFILNYVLRRGFRDGIPGLVFALLMSFHSFLVRGKLWALWQKN